MTAIVQAGPYLSTTNILTLTAAPTPGNLLLAFANNTANATPLTPPSGWVPLLGSANAPATPTAWMGVWARTVQTGDGQSFTFAGGANRGRMFELSNAVAATVQPLGYGGIASTSSPATSITSTSVTPLEASDLAICCFQPLSTGALGNTWTNGFTQLDASTNGSAKTEFATLANPTVSTALSTTEHATSSNNLMMAIVVVKTGAQPPTASVSAPSTVEVGSTVTLDGSTSTAPNSDSLTYAWTLTATPAGSQASLSSATAEQPTLTTDLRGTYAGSLIVTDTTTGLPSTAATATVQAVGPVLLFDTGDTMSQKALLREISGIWA